MATLALGALGTAIGGSIGGTFLGMTAAAVGGMIGSTVGSVVDSWIISSLAPDQRIEGQRLETLRVVSSTEGMTIPRVYGRMRVGGNVIWATDFREEQNTESQGSGKGGGPKVTTTTYLYYCSFAIAICEGPISGIGRIWADGKPMKLEGVKYRIHRGGEFQTPDPFIEATMGAGNAPAYRGTAYVVFEDLPLEPFGNRIPQVTFEVFRPLADSDTAEGMMRAVAMIPGTGEFAYSTRVIRKVGGDEAVAENNNGEFKKSDFLVALDRLIASAPNIQSVALVVSWFGNDLRCGNCQIKPGVEVANKGTTPAVWSVNGISRGSAYVVSQENGRPVYGGTPADFSVVEAIKAIKARGLRVTFYPFLLMDIPQGNSLPNPYSDNAAGVGQDAFPWRGRITCSPAAGYAGSPDKTAAAGDQVASFFGNALNGNFSVNGETVTWTGSPTEWGYRRMVLHYAYLCAAAGGVDAFLLGSELRGLTQIRSSVAGYAAVSRLNILANNVRTILGPGTKMSYAADWSEYFGHQPNDGTGDVYFHLDALWADDDINFIGIDNYMPLSDWRDGHDHLDAQEYQSIYDRAYLQSNIEGGEGYDWYYASSADRAAQIRTPITDGTAGKPWVFRYKDLRAWWSNQHRNRGGGTEGPLTAWVPESKPIWFTEFGFPAVDRGTNQPNVFYDPKSTESAVPYFSRGWRDDANQRAGLEAVLSYWRDNANNPQSSVYSGRMIETNEMAAWAWDARPYPFFPALPEVWSDGENWRLGHWLTGRLGSVPLGALVRHLCAQAGLPANRIDVSGLWGAVEGYTIAAIEAPRTSISVLARHFGFDAVESQGVIRFTIRGRGPVATVSYDDLVAAEGTAAELFELTRGQETELPQALKWQMTRSDEEYDMAVVEARRVTVTAARISADQFPIAVPPEEADRRCRRALMEAWVGRESATFRLPPSRLALDPADVIALDHDNRTMELRVMTMGDNEARNVQAIRQDRAVYDLPPGQARDTHLVRPVVFGGVETIILDIPQLNEGESQHRPLIGSYAKPWPGEVAVYRTQEDDGWELFQSYAGRASFGVLLDPLPSGPTSRWDDANAITVELIEGTINSVTDMALFSGDNVFAIETSSGRWEIVQARDAELIGVRQYRLTKLLRGLRGSEYNMVSSAAAGSRFVVLNPALQRMPIKLAELGLEWNWRIGPASLPFTDDSYSERQFTPEGIGLRPFSVDHIEQPYRTARIPGDLTIRWKRRDRALAADNWQLAEVPMSEDSQEYEIDIMEAPASPVLRTLTSSGQSVVYTASMQNTDLGGLLSAGDTLFVRISQISATFGRGTRIGVTLQF